MSGDTDTLTFTESTAGGLGIAIVIIIAAAILAGLGWIVLMPWPPGNIEIGMFVVLASAIIAFTGFGVWVMGRRREVRIDPAKREVVEQIRFLHIDRSRRFRAADFQGVRVERDASKSRSGASSQSASRIGTSATSQVPTQRFDVLLVGRQERLVVISHEDRADAFGALAVIAAEADALRIAKSCGWEARRSGYRLELSIDGNDTSSRLTDAPGEHSRIESDGQS